MREVVRNAKSLAVANALIQCDHNRTDAAKALDVSRRTILYCIKRCGWKSQNDVKRFLGIE